MFLGILVACFATMAKDSFCWAKQSCEASVALSRNITFAYSCSFKRNHFLLSRKSFQGDQIKSALGKLEHSFWCPNALKYVLLRIHIAWCGVSIFYGRQNISLPKIARPRHSVEPVLSQEFVPMTQSCPLVRLLTWSWIVNRCSRFGNCHTLCMGKSSQAKALLIFPLHGKLIRWLSGRQSSRMNQTLVGCGSFPRQNNS